MEYKIQYKFSVLHWTYALDSTIGGSYRASLKLHRKYRRA